MADVSHFNIKIAVDSKTGQAELVKFGKVGKDEMDKLKKSADGAGSSMLSFSTLLKGAGVAALGMFAAKAVQGAAELENYGVQFEVLTGSAEKGKKLFEEIRAFGAATPFETKDLAAATNTMLGFGIAQESVMGNLKQLGDISGGNAEKLQSLTLAFSQVTSAGKLTGQDLNQMINAGFNPLAEMSAMTGKTMGQLRKEMEQGAISADMVKDAMARATGEGGKFNGMMEKQSKTFQGMLSTLQDTIGMLLAEAGAPILELFKALMPVITPIIEALGKMLQPVIKALVPVVQSLIPPLKVLLDGIFKALAPILDLISKNIGKFSPVLNKLVTAASKLVEAMAPMIDMFAELAEDQLDQLVELLSAVLDLFIAISPAITLVATATANMIGFGVRLMNTVVTPIIDAIKYIIEKGAEAADWVASIFGGGGGKKKGAKSKPQASGGGGGGGETHEIGELSPDGLSKWDGTKWVPIKTGGGGGGAAKEKLTPGSLPDLEAKVKALEALRDKTKAGSDEWASYTLKIAEAQAQVDIFARIAEDLVGKGPDGKGISPFKQVADDIAEIPVAMKPAIDASVALLDQLAESYEQLGSVISDVIGSLAELMNANFEEMKGVSIAQAIINTAVGVTKALEQGGWLGIAGAVAVGLKGAAQVKAIMNTRPGSSGGGGVSGLAQSGSAPQSGGMTPRRLSLSGASNTMVTVTGELIARNGTLTAVLQNETRQNEGRGV